MEDTLAKSRSPLMANRLPNIEGWGDFEQEGVFKGVTGLAVVGSSSFPTISSYYDWLRADPLIIQYQAKTPTTQTLSFNYTYTFPPVSVQPIKVKGVVESTIVSLIIPTEGMNFLINPNQSKENQFIAPTLTLTNPNHAPVSVELKEFNQTTQVLQDVLPDYYESWEGLNQEESKRIALSITPQPSEGWLDLNERPYYVANHSPQTIGTMKGKSSVEFTFSAVHGISFAEPLNPQYQLVFVFNLLP